MNEPHVNFLNLEYFYRKLYELLTAHDLRGIWALFLAWLAAFLASIQTIATILSLLFLIGILYCRMRVRQIREAEHLALSTPAAAASSGELENPKWQRVLEHIHSERESDWRLAILEADVMLEEMLEGMGYHGETIGDRLKRIEASDFSTLGEAWEAHKVRNQIAHEGADFRITNREARRVASLYEHVFKEFKYI